MRPAIPARSHGALAIGDRLGGATVVGLASVPYPFDATYDILPDSDSGAYFAAGALVGSTLAGQYQDRTPNR